jgi:putative selenium metabolism protein SsnA
MYALTGGTLVELRPRRVRRADLLIESDRIRAVGEPIPEGTRTIDCSGTLILPGMVCAHTHLYSSLARGMPPPSVAPKSFTEILERVWWRLDRALDAEAIEVSALVGAVDAIRCGTTTLFDHHASPSHIDGSLDLVGFALERVGVRGVLCYEVTDRGDPEQAQDGIAENDRFLRSLTSLTVTDPGGITVMPTGRNAVARRPRPLLRGMVGAHAGFTLGHATTVALADVAVRRDVGVHIHVAEDAVDAHHVVPVREVTIAEWLEAYRLLSPRSLLAHCVHVDPDGAARLAASGAHIAHNPRSNMNNAVGYSTPARFGEHLVLGTDGIGADMFAEALAGFLAARDHGATFDPLAALGRNQSLAAATFDDGLGRIEAGCPADLAVLAYQPPTPLDENNLFGHLLFGPGASAVRDVIVAGREVMRDRKLLTVDEAALAARAREVAARLWRAM